MSYHMPEIQKLQLKISEARRTGNAPEGMQKRLGTRPQLIPRSASPDLSAANQNERHEPLEELHVAVGSGTFGGSLHANGAQQRLFLQTPIFVSTFLVLRELINYPNEEMKTEGLFWFTNLTEADPYVLLPMTTAATLFVMLKWGVEFGNSQAA